MSTPEIIIGIIILVIVAILIGMLVNMTQVVPQRERLVIYRFGHFHRIVGPGSVPIIPSVDKVVRSIDVRDRPIEITVPSIFAFGVFNELTINLWYRVELIETTGSNRDKLVELIQITESERQEQVQVKMHEVLINQVAVLQERKPLPDTTTNLDGIAALAPGSERHNNLLEGIRKELEESLPSIGVVLNTTHPVMLTTRITPAEFFKAIQPERGSEIDNRWLSKFADDLREQFPDMSHILLAQILALLVKGSEIERMHQIKGYGSGFYNPYIAGLPITNPTMFFGRQSDIKKIIASLTSNFIMITGPRRIGKTSLLHQLVYHLSQLKNTPEKFLPVFVNVEGTSEIEFFHMLMEAIVNVTVEQLPSEVFTGLSFDIDNLSYPSRPFARDMHVLLKNLQNISPQPLRLVLLLDEMDVLNNYSLETQSQLRHIFQNFANRNLSAVVVGVNLQQHWAGETSPFYNMFMPVTLTPLPETEARRLITEPVKGLYHYNKKAIVRILEVTLGMPHRIQQLCLEIIHQLQATSGQQTEITSEDVDSVLQTIQWLDEEFTELNKEDISLVIKQQPVVAEKRTGYEIKPDDKESV